MNSETFQEYMDSVTTLFEFRRDHLKTLYEEKKCPNSAVQYMNQALREFEIMKKRVGKKLVAKRRTGGNTNGALVAPIPISEELTKFLGVKTGTRLGRSEVNRAITAYIQFNPDKKPVLDTPTREAAYKNKLMWVKKLNSDGKVRNLQDPSGKNVIIPDEALSKLLRYKDYVKAVKAGKVEFNHTDPKTRQVSKVVQKDPKLTYSVLQHLLRVHFLKDVVEAVE
jgi:chromatin remodeling complex protein RSC6